MNTLESYFQQIGVSSLDQEIILSGVAPKAFQKGDYFLQEGQISPQIGFILKGVFQYFYNHDGDEITTYIALENNFVVSLGCFLKQIPAKENIRALTDTEVLVISKAQFDALRTQSAAFRQFYIELLEHEIVCIDESRFNLITLTAEERYLKLVAEEPQLLQKVPQQYLASILGITPRHMSRIRKNIR
ncbi:Crp/Fnr family transcriptional regulator [Larkinella knui]|uniref:Crp/Fnr family transcriptional regulator n=1 Tax=Larkinella knui TaxID=2025310 RepID=A0A3P1CV91_9BACT|nr:Crp/Fnr family transcriptional regulator [Larkinella knui]RRB17056.1 Crp/Fnr family transcriptional regulator [Larkinella knui]